MFYLGRNSPLVQFPAPEQSIRPILKHRDDPLPGILKRREKSSSPGRDPSPERWEPDRWEEQRTRPSWPETRGIVYGRSGSYEPRPRSPDSPRGRRTTSPPRSSPRRSSPVLHIREDTPQDQDEILCIEEDLSEDNAGSDGQEH